MKLESVYWVIVVLVLVVVAGLIWFSPRVEVPDEFVPSNGSGIEISTENEFVSECELGSSFSCKINSFDLDSGEIVFVLDNPYGENYLVKELYVEGCGSTSSFDLRRGQGVSKEMDCDFSGNVFEGEVIVYYKDLTGGPSLVSKGSFYQELS